MTVEINTMNEIQRLLQTADRHKPSLVHNFVPLIKAYKTKEFDCISYSMGAVMSGLMLRDLRQYAQAFEQPVSDTLAHHFLTQLVDIFDFLQDTCALVHSDATLSNILVEYPRKQHAPLPDLVLIDFAEVKCPGKMELEERDYESVYWGEVVRVYGLFLEVIGAGYKCGTDHQMKACTDSRHSEDWQKLQRRVVEEITNLQDMQKEFTTKADDYRRMVCDEGNESGEKFLEEVMENVKGGLQNDEPFISLLKDIEQGEV